MHCFNCSSPIPEDLKFCPQCGTPVDGPEEEAAQAEKPAAEAPEVEKVPASELFAEEIGAPQNTVNDDDVFGLGEDLPVKELLTDEDDDLTLEEDSSLDPASPDFDPRKFAGLDQEAFRPMAASELLDEPEEEPEAAAPESGKKGRGGIAALVIVLVLVLAAAAGGLLYWLTAPVKELVLEDNFVQFMGLDAEEKVTAFTVDARETNRFKRVDTVWCSVTVEDGSIHTERDYVMNYSLTTEGWMLASVDELNTETWITKPMTGADVQTVCALLTGRQIQVSDTYAYALTAEDAEATEILSQDTDLEAGTDVVTAAVSVVGELVGWTAEVELALTFDDGWQLSAITHTEPEVEFKPGMEFELTEEDFLEVLVANPIPMFRSEDDVKTTVVTDGEAVEETASAAQTVKITTKSVSELTVLETAFDMEESAQNVTVEFLLDKQVAKLRVEAVLTYVFEDGWKINTVEYSPAVKEINLDGEWKGVYPEVDGRIPGVTLTIGKNEDGTDNNVFAFGPSETDPYFFTGKYYVEAVADAETLEVALNATDWVLYYNPGGVTMVDLKGVLMLDEAVITDGQNFRIALQREVQTEEEAINEEAVAQTVVTTMPGEKAAPPVVETVKPETETVEPEPETVVPPAEETQQPEAVAPPAEETESTAPSVEGIIDNVDLDGWYTPIA